MMSDKLSDYWKVPLRAIYCESFVQMLKATLWCHLVIRVFPHARDLASDGLVECYFDRPTMFFEQYESVLRRVSGREPKPGTVLPTS